MCLCALGIQKHSMLDSTQFSGLMLENVEALTYELPEVGIVCDQVEGKCFYEGDNEAICPDTDETYYECEFTGIADDFCTSPC